MKSLLILRHAQACVARGGVADQDRTLTRHGHAQGRALGRWLKRRSIEPERILCSAAVRARETAQDVAGAAGWSTDVQPLDTLYNASAGIMLAIAREQPRAVDAVLLVAHAPGVPDLAALLTTRTADLALACEPATLIRIAFDCRDWAGLRPGQGALDVVLPA